MARYRIAWLPGDGIGNDVMEAARIVLDAVGFEAEYIPGDVGWEFWKSEGNPLPDRTIDILNNTDACLFGAITSKPKEEAAKELNEELHGKGFEYSSPIVGMRQLLNLHTNMRPCRAFPTNPANFRDGIDITVFRENTEGLYAGIEFYPLPDELRQSLIKHNPKTSKFDYALPDEIAISLRVITKRGASAIITSAFEYARKMGRKKVTVAEKPNVIRETSGLFLRVAREIHKDYPEIQMEENNIDAIAMWLVKNPEDYDVIVTSNLFGDILSDITGMLTGGMGVSAAANIGDSYAVFEPTHGSAPKYAGQNKVNPMAEIMSSKLMLDWLGEKEMADKIYNAVSTVIKEAKVLTYDMGGTASTLDVAKEISGKLEV